jgi:hypothetical protein
MTFTETLAVYPENQVKPINTFCEGNAELLNVKKSDVLSYYVLKSQLL